MSNISEDLRKIMMAGVGAVAAATEKSKEWIEEMAKKGESTAQDVQPVIDDLAQKGAAVLEQGAVFGAEMKGKILQAFDNVKTEAQQLDLDEISESLQGLTDEALGTLKAKLDSLVESRKSAPEGADAAEAHEPHQEADQTPVDE